MSVELHQNHWPSVQEILEMERHMGESNTNEQGDFSWRCNLSAYR